MPTPDSPIISLAREAFSRGDYLTAYALIDGDILTGVSDPELSYLALLCLARSGAAAQAQKLYERVKITLPNREDVEAFAARMTKDQFLAEHDRALRVKLGREARDRYRELYNQTKGSFPAINAATLSLLIGEHAESSRLAAEVLTLCSNAPSRDYWLVATTAEAYLLLGLEGEASSALREARTLAKQNLSHLGTTYRQLREICSHLNINTDLLTPIKPPAVCHYCGHLIEGIGTTPGVRPELIPMLQQQVAERLQQLDVGVAFGSLACGADLIIADELLRRGAELHVVLPFASERFLPESVLAGGAPWEQRFFNALKRATSVRHIVSDPHQDPVPLYAAASQLAMGLAILRAQLLGTEPVQLAAWNGLATEGLAGTATDIALWRSRGLATSIIAVPVTASNHVAKPEVISRPAQWKLCAMVCADVKNFSKIPESELPRFLVDWGERVSTLCDNFAGDILFTNTWGDAVFVVLRTTLGAAQFASRLALTISDQTTAIPAMEVPLGVRVSLHFGPAYSQQDPVLGRMNFYGPHVNKVARLEPCTPAGSVYCSEEFAAALAIADPVGFTCEYAGEQELPKGFGRARMYHLQVRASSWQTPLVQPD